MVQGLGESYFCLDHHGNIVSDFCLPRAYAPPPPPHSRRPRPSIQLRNDSVVWRAYFFFFLGGGAGGFFFGTFSLFFLGKQHVPYILDGFRAISLGFPKKTFIPFVFLKRTKRRKEGRKKARKQGRRKEGRKQGSRNEGREGKKERRRERRKEGRKQGNKEGRKGSKEGGSKEEREAATT